MTIVRLAQAGFDSRFRGEFLSEEISSELDIFESGGYTGTYGLDAGLSPTSYGFGFSPVSQLRAGYWLFHTNVSVSPSGHVVLFNVRQESSGLKHAIRWYGDEDRLSLVIEDVVVESICASIAGINKNEHWLHLGIHIQAGAPGFFSFYLNGERIFNYVDDVPGDFSAVFFNGDDSTSGQWSASVIDDMYVDSTEDEDDGPAPALRFYPSLPVGSGENFDWEAIGEAATYLCVLNAPPLETELAFADEALLLDTHLMTNVTLLGQQIHAVIPYVICRKTDPAINSTILVHLFDGTLYESSAELSPGIGFSHLWDRQTTQPDTTPWNETDVNLIEMGYESAGDYT
jgi:hypothetical protein